MLRWRIATLPGSIWYLAYLHMRTGMTPPSSFRSARSDQVKMHDRVGLCTCQCSEGKDERQVHLEQRSMKLNNVRVDKARPDCSKWLPACRETDVGATVCTATAHTPTEEAGRHPHTLSVLHWHVSYYTHERSPYLTAQALHSPSNCMYGDYHGVQSSDSIYQSRATLPFTQFERKRLEDSDEDFWNALRTLFLNHSYCVVDCLLHVRTCLLHAICILYQSRHKEGSMLPLPEWHYCSVTFASYNKHLTMLTGRGRS